MAPAQLSAEGNITGTAGGTAVHQLLRELLLLCTVLLSKVLWHVSGGGLITCCCIKKLLLPPGSHALEVRRECLLHSLQHGWGRQGCPGWLHLCSHAVQDLLQQRLQLPLDHLLQGHLCL